MVTKEDAYIVRNDSDLEHLLNQYLNGPSFAMAFVFDSDELYADERGRGTAAENRTMAEIVVAAQKARLSSKSQATNEKDFFEGMEELF